MKKLLTLAIVSAAVLSVNAQTLRINMGDVTYAIPAAQAGEMLYNNATTLTVGKKSYPISAITNITIDDSSVSDNTVNVSYNGNTAHVEISGNIAPYITAEVNGSHVNVSASASLENEVTYTLSGNSSNGYRDVVYGAIIENWPDDNVVNNFSCNMTLAGNWVDCQASVEDAYNSNTDTKKSQISASLLLASNNTNRSHYVYTFLSLSNSPATYAATLNPWTADQIGNIPGPLGYVYADYQGSQNNGGNNLLKAIVEQNAKYVYRGQSRINP